MKSLLIPIVGDAHVVDQPDILQRHGKDESFHQAMPPDLVVYPETNAQVSEIVRRCSERRCPVIPFGTGTSLEGQIAALQGGVCIDLSRMDQILALHASDLDCRVQAGITRSALNHELAKDGLFFTVDPGADASLGGMAATRASGTNTVRYGTMADNILGLTVVLADGRIIETGSRARKSAAGYDLTHLMCGSEGTLGVITELSVRCFGRPLAQSAAVCSFLTLAGAVDTVIETIQCGIPVARAELLDDVQMNAVNRYSDLSYPEQSTLFLEFDGTEQSVAEQSHWVAALAAEHGGDDFVWSTLTEEKTRLWQARHDAYHAARAMRPGCEGWVTDVCVPISTLTECIVATRADVDREGMLAPIVGHIGDGNFHVLLLVDPRSESEMATAHGINDRLIERALSVGGTCTGEHGIGYGKLKHLEAEQGEAIDVMRQIKTALDPFGIMNPGKVVSAVQDTH